MRKIEVKMTNLKRLRREKNISIKELAERVNINFTRIQHYESRYRDINKAEALVIYHIAKVLECNMEDILELDSEEEKKIFGSRT